MAIGSGFAGFVNYLNGKSDNQFAKDGGLSADDKKLVKQVWAVVETNRKANGVAFFVALFAKHPEYQDHFATLKGIPNKQLADTPKMRAHGSSVMHFVGNLVENLDDPEVFVSLVKKSAGLHVPRDIGKKYFEVALPFMVQFFEDNFGSQWSPKAKVAWEKVFKAFLGVFDKEYESLK